MRQFVRYFMVWFILAIVAMVALPVLAQTPPAAPALPAFEVYVFGGQVAVDHAGGPVAYSVDFQTQLGAGFRWFASPRFAVDAAYSHDTVRIGAWLARHQFIDPRPVQAFEYSALEVRAEYWPVRNAAGGLFVYAGPAQFFGTGGVESKTGLVAGAGGQYALGRFFVESSVSFVHVNDFLFPGPKNALIGRLAVGFKF